MDRVHTHGSTAAPIQRNASILRVPKPRASGTLKPVGASRWCATVARVSDTALPLRARKRDSLHPLSIYTGSDERTPPVTYIFIAPPAPQHESGMHLTSLPREIENIVYFQVYTLNSNANAAPHPQNQGSKQIEDSCPCSSTMIGVSQRRDGAARY